jgi:hypothetical protein
VPEPDFRAASRDIEQHLDVPEFDPVVARGHTIRRRRRAARAGAVAAAVVAVAGGAVLVPRMGGDPAPDPASPPGVERSAAALLRDPAATVEGTASRVSDGGSVLHRVVVPSPVGKGCDADSRTALVLVGPDGDVEAWREAAAAREFVEVPGGFVVGEPDRTCRAALPEDGAGAYVVTGDGERREVTWAGRAEEVCAVDVDAPRCVFDAGAAVGRLREPDARLVPDRSAQPVAQDGDDLWARSVDASTVSWSTDGGRTWQSHQVDLTGPGLQVAAAGVRAVVVDWPRAEVTTDHGRSWRTVELPAAPERFTVADLTVVVTPDGGLVLVSRPVGGSPLLLAATDRSWQELQPVDLTTETGGIQVVRSGGWLFVPDLASGWRSGDGGLTWEHVDPLA